MHKKILKEFFDLGAEKVDYNSLAAEMLQMYKLTNKIESYNTNNYYNVAHYDFNTEILEIYPAGIHSLKEFIITVLHEVDHMLDHKEMGKNFITEYNAEIDRLAPIHTNPYKHNKFEKKAESFAEKEYDNWKKYFD